MKILFTGASSFTGFWFINALTGAGHKVTSVFTKNKDDYEGTRKTRVELLAGKCEQIYNCKFGDDKFVNMLINDGYDLLCHHAADVTNYKSNSFDVNKALINNTYNITGIIEAVNKGGCKGIVITGSVFEQNEGIGTLPLRAFSPYGLSKSLTWQVFQYYCSVNNVRLGKFVIPNPFGPYEEERFVYYLVKNWFAGNTPAVSTPDYIRDNIHVEKLAKEYLAFAQKMVDYSGTDVLKTYPSGYVGTQGMFTQLVSRELSKRIKKECPFILNKQIDFNEPLKRANGENPEKTIPDEEEKLYWDRLAEYYINIFTSNKKPE